MQIILAPMEGVIDQHMREALTAVGGYTQCATEFIRVVDYLLPDKVFYRLCPELHAQGKTKSGTPVIVQLLGANPEMMAANAVRAVELGAPSIDLNFGCPAKCVTKKNGGAYLLRQPQAIHQIVKSVRTAVRDDISVSAKIRLGFDDTNLALENALAVQSAGANYITVHARTKKDAYRHPARWEWLAKIREVLTIPIVANGDINSVEDYRRCKQISGCEHYMIGRGAVSRPDLARQIRQYQQGTDIDALTWPEIQALVLDLSKSMQTNVKHRYVSGRIKQWLAMLKKEYHEAQHCFEQIRRLSTPQEIEEELGKRLKVKGSRLKIKD
ncbi:MAG: tRNA dihydrouridine synthase [Thiohalomonadales bacterium]